MSGSERRQRLLDFLESHIFRPILQAPLDRVDRREAIEDAQCRTERRRIRYRACATAEEVYAHFLADVDSSSGQLDRELDRVGLPTLAALRGQFLALCDELGLATGEPQASAGIR